MLGPRVRSVSHQVKGIFNGGAISKREAWSELFDWIDFGASVKCRL